MLELDGALSQLKTGENEMSASLPDFQRDAIRAFASQTIVPLIHFRVGGPIDVREADEIGSGTFFEFNERLFLITARHFVEDHKAECIAFPSRPRAAQLISLGDTNHVSPTADLEFIDVAVLEITEPDVIAIIRAGWNVLDFSCAAECPSAGSFLLFGCPSETIRRSEERLIASPVAIFTNRIDEPIGATQPIYSNIDLFFSYTPQVIDIEGKVRNTPSIGGLSGCAVWHIAELSAGELWTAKKALRVVAIQSAALEGEYIRAKAWQWVGRILNNFGNGSVPHDSSWRPEPTAS